MDRQRDRGGGAAARVGTPDDPALSAGAEGGEPEGGSPTSSAARPVPSLEELAQDWLAEPLAPVPSLTDDDGPSGGLDLSPLEAALEENAPPPAAAPVAGPVATPAAESAASVAVGESTRAAPATGPDPWEAELEPARGGGRALVLALAAVTVVGGALAWTLGSGGPGAAAPEDPDVHADAEVRSAAAGTSSGTTSGRGTGGTGVSAGGESSGDAAETGAETGSGVSGGVVGSVGDGLTLVHFEVGLPGPGKTCLPGGDRFSRADGQRLAACYEIARPYEADRVLVLWTQDGEVRRRGLRDTPRAARLVARSLLSPGDHPGGTWVVRLVRDDGGVLTELAQRTVRIDP